MRLIDKIERIPSTEGVVLYLPLDKAYMRGALVQDQSQEANHGTAVNSPVPSQPGFLFNGSTQLINCGQDASLDITTLSITAWVKLKSGHISIAMVAAKRQNFIGSAYMLCVDQNKKIGINGGNTTIISGDEVLPEEKWTFVGASYNSTTGKIYVNNSAPETETITVPASQAFDLMVGANNSFDEASPIEHFGGHIADVRIYNRVLTDNQFLAHYNIQRGKYGV